MTIRLILMRWQSGFKISGAALSIHARTRAQMYKGHSDWSHIARGKTTRITMPILVGDIDSPEKH
jgi:tRNA-dihydrouridine synthase